MKAVSYLFEWLSDMLKAIHYQKLACQEWIYLFFVALKKIFDKDYKDLYFLI